MSELSMGQRDTIRIAYRAAEKSGDDTVVQGRVRQLAKDFKISEEEVLSIAQDDALAKNKASAKVAPDGGHRSRSEWTPEQVRQLINLYDQGKGPTAIAGALGRDVKCVQAKLYNLKKSGAPLRKPVPAVKAPETPAQSPAAPKPEIREADSLPPPSLPAKLPAPPAGEPFAAPVSDVPIGEIPARDSEYESALAKLTEPEPVGIKLLTEITELADHLECAYSAKILLLQANPAAGWASCSFDVDGRRYSVSLREKRREGSM